MWKRILDNQPPLNRIIKTKIDDHLGCRNVQYLIFDGKLWWNIDKTSYIYYQPTHWLHP